MIIPIKINLTHISYFGNYFFFIYVSYKGDHSVIYTIVCNSKILVLHVKYFKIMDFKIGDVVQIGTSGHKGKIVNIIQPTGTYSMYTIHNYFDGTITHCAKHELVKGMDDFLFEEMFNDFQEYDNIPLACNSLPNKSDSTTTASDSLLDTISMSATIESLVNDPNLSPVLLSPGINLPHHIANFIDNIPVATGNTKLNYTRFLDLTDDDFNDFVLDNENINTRKKTEGHIRLFTQFLMVNNYTCEMNTISAIELNNLLCKFFVGVRQKNGEEYEPSYLRGMLGSFERHLKRKNYGISLISGYEFCKARDVLKC